MRHEWMDKCEGCGIWYPLNKLVRQTVRRNRLTSQNLFAWSKYNSAGWTSTAIDAGAISMSDNSFRIHTANDANNTNTEKGTQTWTGSGVLTSAAVDCSTYVTVVFSIRCGHYQQSSRPKLVVTLGAKKGANDYPIVTSRTVVGATPVWGVLTLADVDAADRSALQFYIDVTPVTEDDKYWIDSMQFVSDKTEPGPWLKTSGTARTYTTPRGTQHSRVSCPKCREKWTRVDRGTYVDDEERPEIQEQEDPEEDGS